MAHAEEETVIILTLTYDEAQYVRGLLSNDAADTTSEKRNSIAEALEEVRIYG